MEQKENSSFPTYFATWVENSDKIQLDLGTQCASIFNLHIRPTITVESIENKNVIVAFVPELPNGQKPAYFRNESLPLGAYRRIGSSDQRCTDDDLFIFFKTEDRFDSTIVKGSSIEDISDDAITLYRQLRNKVNPYVEELHYNNYDLLHSLGCIQKDYDKIRLTYAGLLLFGTRIAHRRLLPMVRVDYIRVSGNEWIEDPENRFTTIDMRGSLLELIQRVFNQISDDLPKGFVLTEGQLQAENNTLPTRVLREAIVNSLIHRTYRENQPIQIIRYGNRIEIKNPGFSLKPEDHLGEPGSRNRNPFIAAVFHETNLAETKGSGIRTMRKLMKQANLMLPTFESDHSRNQFTVRLLLHHFLDTNDVKWLFRFAKHKLNEDQKRALIFTREVGAIDNSSYRQLNGVDLLKASGDLRDMRIKELLTQKGKGRSTYYVMGKNLMDHTIIEDISNTNTPPFVTNTPPQGINEHNKIKIARIVTKIPGLGVRMNDTTSVNKIILELCKVRPFKAQELAKLFNKREDYFKRKYLTKLITAKELKHTHPEMINHPEQAYVTIYDK